MSRSDTQQPVPEEKAPAQHDFALESVPQKQRRSGYALVTVWVGWAISTSSLLVGGTVGAGTSFGVGLTAIVIGNTILAIIAALVGFVGFRTGLTTYLASRSIFGDRGSAVPSLLLGVLAMGFIGVLMDAFATAMNQLVPSVPWLLWIVLFTIAITATAIFGFKGLAVLSVVSAPAMVLFAIVSVVRISEGDGLATAVAAEPVEPIGFQAALTAVIATWITGATLVSDVGRYARRPVHIVIGAVCGYVVGAGVFEATAMLSASAAGNGNFVVVMSQLGLLLPAALILALTLWTTTDNNLYSASLAFTNASRTFGRTIDKRVWVLVSVAIAVATALAGFASDFGAFLGIIATVTPPFAGIFIAHFYVLGHLRTVGSAPLPAVRWSALGAWLATALLAYLVDLPVEPVSGLLIAGAVYSVAGLLSRRTESRQS